MGIRSEDDKLNELKEMVIGVWILKNKSAADWEEYRSRNDQQWIWTKGMAILLTEEMIELMMDKSENEIWKISNEFICPSREVQRSMVRLGASVSKNRLERGEEFLKRHQVIAVIFTSICWVVRLLVERADELNNETIDYVVDFLVRLLECDDMEMVKWAILTGEKLWVMMKTNSEKRDRLRTAITRNSTHSDTLEQDLHWWDTERYQVGWCARWCKENLLEDGLKEMPWAKLSPDRFEVRNDKENIIGFHLLPVRSPFPVKSNVYYYEVICMTKGDLQVGWATRQSRMDVFKGIDKNKQSIWLNVGKECFIQQNNRYPSPSKPPSSPLYVIGCLLDLDKKRFEFYINGRKLDSPAPEHFSSQPYFATARLANRQHCHFNFGQGPFKFPPKDIKFTTFHKQTGGDESKYRLVETEKYSGFFADHFWFCHPPVVNKVSLFFDDEMQNAFDRQVNKMVGEIENGRIGEWRVGYDDYDDDGFDGYSWIGLRYIQAILELTWKGGRKNKMDMMAQWIGMMVEGVIGDVYKEKLLELLYSYLHLIPTQSTLNQHCSICIVLLHLIRCDRYTRYSVIGPIHRSVFKYLTRTLTSTTDQWIHLFVLIALGIMKLKESEMKTILENQQIMKMFNNWKDDRKFKDFVELEISTEECNFIIPQLRLITELSFQQVEVVTHLSRATLNINDRTNQLKLSSDCLSARSDFNRQSVRSKCHVAKGSYYFEAVLLTNGPMRIGWSTKRTELDKTEVGGDEFSIAFDGYNRCVWHNNEELKLETNISRWRAGDVIGCLFETSTNTNTIEKENKRIYFYLNGKLIIYKIKSPIYYSPQPYHVSISLSSHQQAYINFGQTKFMYSPQKDYLTFFNHPQKASNQMQSITNSVVCINNINFTNTSPAISSEILKTTMESISFSNQKAETASTIDYILIKDQTTDECITCPECHKEIQLKRILIDCCGCLKLSTEKPSCTELIEITSTATEESDQFRSSLELSTQKSTQTVPSLELSTKNAIQTVFGLELSTQNAIKLVPSLELSTKKSTHTVLSLELSTQNAIQTVRPLYDHELASPTSINRLNTPIEFTHKWFIQKFDSLFNDNKAALSVMYSETFPVSDEIMFSLRMVPAYSEGNEVFVSMFLYLEKCQLKNDSISVTYEISILNIEPDKSHSRTETKQFQVEKFWGWKNFIKRSELMDSSRGFLINDSISIVCKVEIQSENEQIAISNNQTENYFDCNLNVNQIRYFWEIPKFDSFFRSKNSEIKYVQSDIFPTKAQNRYFLRMWPKGIDEMAKDYVSMFLYLESSSGDKMVDVNYRLSILDSDGDVYHTGEGRGTLNPRETNSKDDQPIPVGKGSSKYIALERILNPENGLLPNFRLTIYCEIEEKIKQMPQLELLTNELKSLQLNSRSSTKP